MNNSVNRVYCLETRIANSDAEYFKEFIPEFAGLCRRIWQDLKHDVKTDSKYVTVLCRQYGYMKRTVNSALRQMKGRASALKELTKIQIRDKETKIETLKNKIEKITVEINNLKAKVEKHPNDKDLLQRYKNKKRRRYSWQQRIQKYKNDIHKYETDKSYVYNMCFGSKHFFREQYNLTENGYNTHEKWLNNFRKARDRQVYYIGSSDETCGNQMCQLEYLKETDRFMLKVRKENKYCKPDASKNDRDNYVWLDIDFKYRKDLLLYALENGLSLTYTITRKDEKWYIDVAISVMLEIQTDTSKGCIGLDYNNGFIAVTETDGYGNIIGTDNIPLIHHGTGNKAKSELSEKISKIVRYTRSKGKALCIENLRFSKKKSQQIRKGKREYNKMLHLLDYSRYKQLCIDYGATYGVLVKLVNPAYTSKIGKQKYAGKKKLTVHQSAAYVIARRGQGYEDEYNGQKVA